MFRIRKLIHGCRYDGYALGRDREGKEIRLNVRVASHELPDPILIYVTGHRSNHHRRQVMEQEHL
jgi:hypothetical protein